MNRREIVLTALTCVVIVVVLTGLGWVQSQVDSAQRSITCVSAESNIKQLEALEEIADRLGIPHDFKVPEVPPECDGF